MREEEALVATLIRRGEAKACTADDPPARILESYVMWRLEQEVLGVDAARDMASRASKLLDETFLPGVKAKLDRLMFGVRDCRSTREVQALAERIVHMLGEEAHRDATRSTSDQGMRDAGDARREGSAQRALDAPAEDHARGIGELAQAAINAKGREAPARNLPLARGTAAPLAPGAAQPRVCTRGQRGNARPAPAFGRFAAGERALPALSGIHRTAPRHASPRPHRGR